MRLIFLLLLSVVTFQVHSQASTYAATVNNIRTPIEQLEYNGLVALWPLDGNGYEISGKDLRGYPTQTQTYAAGKMTSQAALIDANGKYVYVADQQTPLGYNYFSFAVGQPFAMEAWIYPTSAHLGFILSKGVQTGTREYNMIMEANRTISVLITNPTITNYLYVLSVGTVPLNQWSFVQVSHNGSTSSSGVKIWINGVAQSVTTANGGTYAGMTNNGDGFMIGATIRNDNNHFVGRINYAALYNREFTQADADNRYNSGNGLPYINSGYAPLFDYYFEPLKILAQQGVYMLASDVTTGGTNLKWSSNSGSSWTNYNWGTQWSSGPVYNKTVDFAYMFSDGTALFSCGNVLYRIDDGLSGAPDVITPQLMDGSPYPVHTPANSIYPGNYFQHGGYMDYKFHTVGGNEMLVWSNYCNVALNLMGVAPTTVWYTIDKGATVKALYRFGQDTDYRDNGTAGGSASTGTLLGDASNSITVKHTHGTYRNQSTLDWYTATGDYVGEAHWIKHTYDIATDTWTHSQISGISTNSPWQNAGLWFEGTKVYWGQDSPASPNPGFFSAEIADIGVTYTQLGNMLPETYGIRMGTNNIFLLNFNSSSQANATITIFKGRNVEYVRQFEFADINGLTNIFGHIGGEPNAAGYYAINQGILWSAPIKTLYFKIY